MVTPYHGKFRVQYHLKLKRKFYKILSLFSSAFHPRRTSPLKVELQVAPITGARDIVMT